MTLLTTMPGYKVIASQLTMQRWGCMRMQSFRVFQGTGWSVCKKYSWLCCLVEPEEHLLAQVTLHTGLATLKNMYVGQCGSCFGLKWLKVLIMICGGVFIISTDNNKLLESRVTSWAFPNKKQQNCKSRLVYYLLHNLFDYINVWYKLVCSLIQITIPTAATVLKKGL